MTTPTRSPNSLQAKQRQETDDKVVAAIEEHGALIESAPLNADHDEAVR